MNNDISHKENIFLVIYYYEIRNYAHQETISVIYFCVNYRALLEIICKVYIRIYLTGSSKLEAQTLACLYRKFI